MNAPEYYFDLEFIECARQRRLPLLDWPVGRPVNTVDLLSLGLVSAYGRELYLLNRECELDDAWQNQWVRENVLGDIYRQYISEPQRQSHPFTLATLRLVFSRIGVSRQEMARRVLEFVFPARQLARWWNDLQGSALAHADGERGILLPVGVYYTRAEVLKHLSELPGYLAPIFYTYYGAYDWVCFCQHLFGRMNDLPAGMPMYAFDLKQEQDRLGMSKDVKRELCPNPTDEHNALADARWNQQFHQVLKSFAARP